jgi:uncharacterized protein (TIGR02147 family)
MSLSVFDYIDYRNYLLHWLENRPNGGRGEKLKLSEALSCQPSYISQVFAGSANLSFEQAETLNTVFGHTDEESQFFLLLVHLARAGTEALKKRLRTRIQAVLDHRKNLKNRLAFEKSISREDQAIYYSAWYYSAVHFALAIPALRSQAALARAFHLPQARVAEVLEFLVTRGLAVESRGQLVPGSQSIHLENRSPMISKHHTNWRMQAIQSLEREAESELHYSSVITVSEGDAVKIREALVKAIEQVRLIVKPSKDEALYCYNLDLFKVTG